MSTSLRNVFLASLLGTAGTDALALPAATTPSVVPPALLDSDQQVVQALMHDTRLLLREHGIAGRVTGRVKSRASLHAKMRRKGVSEDRIYDRLALRVHVDSVEQAYRVRELLEARHRPIPGERDDYIAAPKANGYQSLHSALRTRLGEVAEFQVRTHAMHRHAEHGGAAHWAYKQAQALAV